MEQGWVKFHRRIVNWEWYDDPNTFRMFFHLIVTANHKDDSYRGKLIKRGQKLTSIRHLADELSIDEKTVQRCLRNLQSTKEIKVDSSRYGTLITVRKYGDYQGESEFDVGTIPTQPPTPAPTPIPTQPPTPAPTKQEYNNVRMEEEGKGFSDENPMSGCDAPPTKPSSENVNYDKLVAYFNTTTKGVFGTVQLPLSETRKASVRARIREHGKEAFIAVIAKAMASDFLKGQNQRGFKATFDWLIKPTNFEKVLSGNYDNHENIPGGGGYKGDATIGTEFTRKS